GIVFAMASALTLLPAILFAFGRIAFWPKRVKYDPDNVAAEQGVPGKGLWPSVAQKVKNRRRSIWIVTTLVLLVGAAGATQLEADGVAQAELVLGQSDARDGQEVLGEHFTGGSGSTVQVIAAEFERESVDYVIIDLKEILDLTYNAKYTHIV